jgi:hypothetical protein
MAGIGGQTAGFSVYRILSVPPDSAINSVFYEFNAYVSPDE